MKNETNKVLVLQNAQTMPQMSLYGQIARSYLKDPSTTGKRSTAFDRLKLENPESYNMTFLNRYLPIYSGYCCLKFCYILPLLKFSTFQEVAYISIHPIKH